MTNVSYIPPRGGTPPGDESPYPVAGAGEVPGLTLRQLVSVLWRRKAIIITTVLVICTLSALAVMQAKPLFVAEALVVVEPQREKVLKIDSVLQGVNPDFYTNETEAAVIRSRLTAAKVVDKLNLLENPLFNPDLVTARPGLLAELITMVDPRPLLQQMMPDWVLDQFESKGARKLGAVDPRLLSPAQLAALRRDQAIDRLQEQLKVEPSERSRVISIRATLEDPELAAKIANAIAAAYIEGSVRAKSDATARASDWLNDQAAELRNRVEVSQHALEDYRRASGIVDLKNQTTLLTQQLAELNTKLISARTEQAEAEARYLQTQKLVASPEGITALAAVLQSPLIQRLREQEAVQQRELAELRTQLRDEHPRLIQKRNELKDLEDKIAAEIRKIGANQKNELDIARIRTRNIQVEVDGLRQRIAAQNEAEVKLRALETEANANKQLYETILARFKETGVQEQGVQQSDARLISPAAVPLLPAYPRKTLIVALAFIGSTVLGVMLVFVVEHLDAGFRSMQQVEAVLGAPAIGMVPRLTRRVAGRATPQDFVLEKPNSVFGEGIRSIRTALLLANVDTPPRTVLFTSSLPDEGKTSTAVCVARAAAKAGQRTVVLDCDLRHASVHEALGGDNSRGVVEVLSGAAKLEEVLQVDARSGCHFIAAGQRAPNPTDLLGSDAMRRLLKRLYDAYDLVVIDTPPVLAVSDALVLLRAVDKTVFLVRWGKTRREAAQAGMRLVLDANADLGGVVLTQVDARKQSRYHYADSTYYYYGATKKYYTD